MDQSHRSAPYRKRGRMACKQCRQSKVRCNLDASPCTRCSRLGLACVVDPHFQRITRREQVADLEQQVQQLQNTVNGQAAAGRPTRRHSRNLSVELGAGASDSRQMQGTTRGVDYENASPTPEIESVRSTMEVSGPGAAQWTVGGVSVNEAKCVELFRM